MIEEIARYLFEANGGAIMHDCSFEESEETGYYYTEQAEDIAKICKKHCPGPAFAGG